MLKPIILLLQLICYCYTLHNKLEKEHAYSDVLKNITLANKLLQELIKNYEKLEQISQSEECLQMHSTSTETDQIFKSLPINNPKTKQKDRSNRKYTSKPFLGTAMIYETLSDEKVSEDLNKKTKAAKKNRRPVQTNSNNFDGKKINNEDLNTRFHIINNNKSKNKKILPNSSVSKSEAKSIKSSEDEESEEVEQIIIDIPKEVSSVVLNTPYAKIIKSDSKDKPITNIWGTKTRFSIQNSANRKEKTNLPRDGNLGKDALRSRNDSRGSKNNNWPHILSSNKIRENIINKPARLKKHNSNLQNDIFLRSEYGETCLQMPIKKCKKALKKVNKNICKRHFKCKSDFKSDFIQNSKDGCNEEFAYRVKTADKQTVNDTESEKHEKFSPPEFRELRKKSLKNDRREQKGSVKVLHKYKKLNHFISLRNETPLGAFLRRKRDRYEKKCQKESRKKCNNACSYALKETCSIHTCEKRRKKAINSECKTQCKIAYKDTKERVKSSSKSDSESDTESDSQSESESDSD